MNKLLKFIMIIAISFYASSCSEDEDPILVPGITSVSPLEAVPGQSITITGVNIGNAISVSFGTFTGEIDSNTATSITTKVPMEAAHGENQITVTTSGGTATHTFTIIDDTPTFASIAPDSKQGSVGDEITITGAFLEGSQIFFGTIEASIVSSSAAEVVFIIPEGAVTGPITVRTARGEFQTGEFTIVEPRLYIYRNGVTADGIVNQAGHANTIDRSNTEITLDGHDVSTKVTFEHNKWGETGFLVNEGLSLSTEGYSEVVVKIYGLPGAKKLNFWLREAHPNQAQGDIQKVRLENEPNSWKTGEWVTVTIPISKLGNKKTGTPSGAAGPFNWTDLRFGATTDKGTVGDDENDVYYIGEIYFQ